VGEGDALVEGEHHGAAQGDQRAQELRHARLGLEVQCF
jgi:hypothetical protein